MGKDAAAIVSCEAIEERQHCARGARAEIAPQHRIEAERSLQKRRVKVLLEQVIYVHADDAQQLAHVAATEASHPPGHSKERQAVRPGVGAEPRRHTRHDRVQRPRQTPQPRHILRIGQCVRARSARERAAVTYAECQRRTARRQRARRHGVVRKLEAMRAKIELRDQALWHQMQQMGAGGDPIARSELARHRRASDLLRSLKHEHRAATLRKIGGADEAVMTAADHDAVVARTFGHCRRHGQCVLRRSRNTARAAFAPGAPITPPPGWVLEPHI